MCPTTPSLALVDALRSAGIDAQRVCFKGHRHEVPFPDPEGDGRSEHWVVDVAGIGVVDITRRQFDPDAELPTFYATVDAAGRDWTAVYVDEMRTKLRPLPA